MNKAVAVLCVAGIAVLLLPVVLIYMVEPENGRLHRFLEELAKA